MKIKRGLWYASTDGRKRPLHICGWIKWSSSMELSKSVVFKELGEEGVALLQTICCTMPGLDNTDHSSHAEGSRQVGPLWPPNWWHLYCAHWPVKQWDPLIRVYSGGAGQEEISPVFRRRYWPGISHSLIATLRQVDGLDCQAAGGLQTWCSAFALLSSKQPRDRETLNDYFEKVRNALISCYFVRYRVRILYSS